MSSIGVTVTDQESLTDMVWANADRFAEAVGFRGRAEDSWLDVTTREFAAQVLAVARGLIATGRRPGDRVTTGRTGYEWAVAQFAVWATGCVSAPAGAGETPVDLGELAEAGRDVADQVVRARTNAVRADDPALVVASARRTHRELLGEVRTTIRHRARLFGTGRSMLVRVPMDDAATQVLGLCCVYTRTTLGISGTADIATYRPSVLVAAPALLEEVLAAARRRAYAEDRGRLFETAEAVAVDYSRALERTGPGLTLIGKHMAAGRLVYPKVRAALGGRCTTVICVGGAPDPRLRHFFRGIGVAVHSS